MQVIISSSTLSAIQNDAQGLFTSVLPLLVLTVSIPLAFYVVRKIMAMFPKGRAVKL